MAGWERISNPIRSSTGLGKYKVTECHQQWKSKSASHYIGGNFVNNPLMEIINTIMSAACSMIPDYTPSRYEEKVGLVCTIKPYVQVPHLDFDRNGTERGIIIHAPLCEEGSWIYIWKANTRSTPKQKQMLFLPFGSMLVLDGDVWHWGIFGSPGNVRFHAAIIPTKDAKVKAELVYKPGDKQWMEGMNVAYEEAISILPKEQTEDITKIILYIKSTFSITDSLLSPLPG